MSFQKLRRTLSVSDVRRLGGRVSISFFYNKERGKEMTTFFEKEGFINLDKLKPKVGERVCLIKVIYYNTHESKQWETTGIMRENGNFYLKNTDGLTLGNSIPTHWKKL